MRRELLEVFFKKYGISFSLAELNSAEIYPEIMAGRYVELASIQLNCDDDDVIAFYPAKHRFDLSHLNRMTCKNHLNLLTPGQYEVFRYKLLNNKLPELNQGVNVYIDDAVKAYKKVFIRNKFDHLILIVDSDEISKLTNNKLMGMTFSDKIIITKEIQPPMNFKERVKAMHSLPPMPETASEILKLRSLPDVKVEHIVAVIEKDPLLAAQIVRYANSAFFGQAGSVKSVKDAIFRVLGVEAVLNMALALSIGTTFKMQREGPIGAAKVWQSSVYVASLMQRITMFMPWGQRLNPGTAYLVGLLHDIGLLVLGHLFPDEYQKLNQLLQDEPGAKILEAENTIFGVTHTEIGKIVMRLWNMPEELIAVTTSHHNSEFEGEHEEYIQLLVIVESLLSQHGLARDDYEQDMPMHFLEKLHIDEEDVIIAADEVLQEGQVIQELARQMYA